MTKTRTDKTAYVITGPTSGMGYQAALELAKYGTVILVGRSKQRLAKVEAEINSLPDGKAVSVVADLSDIKSARNAAAEIAKLGLEIRGVANNAGIRSVSDVKSAQGWDISFATNILGPLAFTDALIPHLSDGTMIEFTVSAVEDSERKPALAAGFRGSRYISAEASARGEWLAGGSKNRGFDSYATTKQGGLAAAFSLSREFPRLRFAAIEPGLIPSTGLGREESAAIQVLSKVLTPVLKPFISIMSTPKQAGRLIASVVTDPAGPSGVYYGEKGQLIKGSAQVNYPAYADRYVAECRQLIATVPLS